MSEKTRLTLWVTRRPCVCEDGTPCDLHLSKPTLTECYGCATCKDGDRLNDWVSDEYIGQVDEGTIFDEVDLGECKKFSVVIKEYAKRTHTRRAGRGR